MLWGGAAAAADWERLEKLPGDVSSSEVVIQFVNEKMMPLLQYTHKVSPPESGVLADRTLFANPRYFHTTVGALADFVNSWELDNGAFPKFLTWGKKGTAYAGVWVLPPGNDKMQLLFGHLLSKRLGAGARSSLGGIKGGERVFGSSSLGIALKSVFFQEMMADTVRRSCSMQKSPCEVHMLELCCQLEFERHLKERSGGAARP